MPQVNFNTRIEYETHQLLQEFIAEEKVNNPKISQASVTDTALKEYIQRQRQEKQLKAAVKGDK